MRAYSVGHEGVTTYLKAVLVVESEFVKTL